MGNLYSNLLLAEFFIALPIFVLLMFVKAPYGKYQKTGWGPIIDARFSWFIMELPAVLIPLFFFFKSDRAGSPLTLFFIVIWEIHYVQRTFLFPILMNRGSHRMPLLIILLSAAFNVLNGGLNGYGIFVQKDFATESLSSINLIAGVLIFISGFILNLYSDHVLRGLRAKGESGYKIPERGLYRFICSPNYLGEILEWAGWALITLSPAGAAFFVFTVANLAPRASANLKWYRKNFSEYPKDRKALIPYIF